MFITRAMAERQESYISQGDMAKAAPFISGSFFIIAVFLSLFSDSLYIGGWIGLSLLGVLLLPIGFPHTWRYAFWLGAMYIVFTIGTLIIYYLIMKSLLGILIIPLFFLAGLVITWMLFEKARMDRFLQYRLFKGTGVHVQQSPIGLWFIALILFDAFSVVSGVGIGRWIFAEAFFGIPFMYIISEILLTILFIFILYYPEKAFPWEKEGLGLIHSLTLNKEKIQGISGQLSPSRILKKKTSYIMCPSCKSPLVRTELLCPACGSLYEAGWCVKHESLITPCPHCEKLTLRNKERCRNCNEKTGFNIQCTSCKKEFPIREWKRKTPKA